MRKTKYCPNCGTIMINSDGEYLCISEVGGDWYFCSCDWSGKKSELKTEPMIRTEKLEKINKNDTEF